VRGKKKPQISPLRCAPVEMTNLLERGFVPLLERYRLKFVANLSSRPELPWASDPPKVMKNASVQQLLSKEPSPFPLSSRAKPRDLQFRGPFVEMFFDRSVAKWRDLRSPLWVVGTTNLQSFCGWCSSCSCRLPWAQFLPARPRWLYRPLPRW
jgi:hypothetical protein